MEVVHNTDDFSTYLLFASEFSSGTVFGTV